MTAPADRLLELQRQLYALADQLEAEPTHVAELRDWQARHDYEDRICDQYAKTATELLIESYLLGGFQANPKWRNTMATWQRASNLSQRLFWRTVYRITSSMAGLLHAPSWSYYWPNVFKTEAGYLRALASRV